VWTTPVKNQGYCGSCWAFSAVEQIETDYWMASGNEAILSPQQVTSCDKTAEGCNGGWTEHAYEYVIRAGGIEGDSDYPYTSGTAGVTGSCKANAHYYVVSIGGYETVSSSASGETAMANYVAATGPLSICVDAETWSSYTGGVMSVCGQSVDHCVQAVGLDTTSATSPYWIVRNSWGVTWGNAGYIYLAYGKNTCNLASDATYVTGATAYVPA
jgi:C1A family cysteine protease